MTDRQTDRQTDTPPIAKSRSNIVERDKHSDELSRLMIKYNSLTHSVANLLTVNMGLDFTQTFSSSLHAREQPTSAEDCCLFPLSTSSSSRRSSRLSSFVSISVASWGSFHLLNIHSSFIIVNKCEIKKDNERTLTREKLSCRREAARHYMSLKILQSHSSSLKVIWNYTTENSVFSSC